MPRKPGKTGAVKGETLTIRVPPKMKFALELMSRRQHRPISSIVLSALEPVLQGEESGLMLNDSLMEGKGGNLTDLLWDPRKPIRIVKLGMLEPGLLTFDEEFLWRVIKEDRQYWMDDLDPNIQLILENWRLIQDEAGKQERSYG